MREVLRGFRLKIKGHELAAETEIDKIMARPTLNSGNLQQLNEMIIKATMKGSMDALREGVTFGNYIKKQAGERTAITQGTDRKRGAGDAGKVQDQNDDLASAGRG